MFHVRDTLLSMKIIYGRLKEFLPSLNRRKITWRMIQRACRRLGAKLFNIPLRLDGYFVPANLSESGLPEIYVNSRLAENLQIATSVHEIKHAVFDTAKRSILFSYRAEWTVAARRELEEYRRYEFEACAMGAIALLPEKKLKHASRGFFDLEDEFIEDVWRIRLLLREIYGI